MQPQVGNGRKGSSNGRKGTVTPQPLPSVKGLYAGAGTAASPSRSMTLWHQALQIGFWHDEGHVLQEVAERTNGPDVPGSVRLSILSSGPLVPDSSSDKHRHQPDGTTRTEQASNSRTAADSTHHRTPTRTSGNASPSRCPAYHQLLGTGSSASGLAANSNCMQPFHTDYTTACRCRRCRRRSARKARVL